ncbi:MAG: hypothetical protein Fues2KO_34800 [Fuerstiella sp.]
MFLVGLVFLTDEHRWDRSGLQDYVESAEERADAAASGNRLRRMAFLSLGGTGILLLLSGRQLPSVREPMGLCLVLATAWTFASVLWADSFSFTLKRLLLLVLCSTGVIGIARTLTLRQLCLLLLSVTTCYLLLGILAEVMQSNFRPWQSGYRFAGTLHPNAQSTNCGAMALAAYTLWRDARPSRDCDHTHINSRRRLRWSCGCLFVLALVFLLLTRSRTAAAAVLLTLGIIKASTQRMGANLVLAAAGLMLAAVAGFGVFVSGIDDSVSDAANMGRADSQGAFNGRLPIWEICVKRVGRQLPVGFGYDGFWTGDRIESVSAELGWSISSAHSEYIEIALGLGLIGLGLYVSVQFLGIAWFWLRYFRLHHPGDAMVLGLLLLGFIQGFMETGAFHPSSLTPFVTLTGLTRLALFTDHQTAFARPI